MTPAEYSDATLAAFLAFKEGKANEGQQIAVLEHILLNICRIRHLSFAGHDAQTTAFNEGSRFVGLQIAGMFDPKAKDFTIEAKASKRPTTRKTKTEAKND